MVNPFINILLSPISASLSADECLGTRYSWADRQKNWYETKIDPWANLSNVRPSKTKRIQWGKCFVSSVNHQKRNKFSLQETYIIKTYCIDALKIGEDVFSIKNIQYSCCVYRLIFQKFPLKLILRICNI